MPPRPYRWLVALLLLAEARRPAAPPSADTTAMLLSSRFQTITVQNVTPGTTPISLN